MLSTPSAGASSFFDGLVTSSFSVLIRALRFFRRQDVVLCSTHVRLFPPALLGVSYFLLFISMSMSSPPPPPPPTFGFLLPAVELLPGLMGGRCLLKKRISFSITPCNRLPVGFSEQSAVCFGSSCVHVQVCFIGR